MKYIDTYFELRKAFSTVESKIELENVVVHKYCFQSSSYNLLPGTNSYSCQEHNLCFQDIKSFYNDIGTIQGNIRIQDNLVEENRNFCYYVLVPKGTTRVKKATFLFHGFNEKSWDKYLVWGNEISEQTQSAVIFFPNAFHMQRAPLHWSEKKEMFILSEKRKKRFPHIINSTLANIAISMRLHSMPQRFIWSGLQTYYDIIQFIENCKNDKHELIDKDFTFNVFAYSIGGFIAQILKLSNYKNYFSDTKVCLFCSGAVFNRLSPVSKFILDSEANVALYSYLVEHFDSFLKEDPLLSHYIENHLEGKVFHSMLDYQKMRVFRENRLKNVEKHMYAIALKNDSVIPTFEIVNTLKGAFRNINIAVDEFDFDFDYSHENPFPIKHANPHSIDSSFKMVFEKVCNFLN